MAPRIALGGLLKLRLIRKLTLLCALSGLVVACDPFGAWAGSSRAPTSAPNRRPTAPSASTPWAVAGPEAWALSRPRGHLRGLGLRRERELLDLRRRLLVSLT